MELIERLQIASPTKVNEHGVFAQCDLLKAFESDMRQAAAELISLEGVISKLFDTSTFKKALAAGEIDLERMGFIITFEAGVAEVRFPASNLVCFTIK